MLEYFTYFGMVYLKWKAPLTHIPCGMIRREFEI